jgi:hypothetical protein
MPSARRRALAGVMLVISSVALLATSPAQYEPDISDQVSQELELSGDQPVGATTVRLLVSAQALAGLGESAESNVRVFAAAPDGAGDLTPEFRVTATAGESEAYNDGSNPETVSWRIEELCAAGPCDAALEITVEWLNAVPGQDQPVVVTVEAGIDYRSGWQEGEAPDGAQVMLEVDQELERADPSPMLRAQTEPETITLSADAPFALRHVLVEVAPEAIPTDIPAEEDQSAIFAVSGLDEELAVASVWPDPEQGGHDGGAPGSVLPLWCEQGIECRIGYTLMLLWTGREPNEVATITWGFTSVLRYTDRAVAPPQGLMQVSVDRVVDTSGDDRDRLEIEVGGSIERAPDDPFIREPVEPGDGPHLIGVDLPTWQPVPEGSNVGVPTTGVMTLSARSADGSGLNGPVTVSVVTRYPVVHWGPPRNHELTPAMPELTFAVLPSMSCYDPDLEEPVADGRCTVPFDIFVQPPDEVTGPVVVEWSLHLQAVAPDGLTLQPGDVRAGPTR